MEAVSGRAESENNNSQLFEFQDPQRGNSIAEKDTVMPELDISML